MEKDLFSNLKAILIEYRWRFLKAFLMVLTSNILLIANPVVLRQAVMALDPHLEKPAFATFLTYFFGNRGTFLSTWVFLLLTITVISAYFKYQMRVAFISVSRDVEMQVRDKLFDRIQSQSMEFFDRHGIGELLSRLTNDISAYRDVLGPGIMYPLFFLTLVVPGLAALFYISFKLTLLSLIPLIAIPLLNRVLRGHIFTLSLAVQRGLAEMSNATQEYYSGIRIIKGYAVEEVFFQKFRSICQKLIGLNIRLASMQGLIFPFLTFLTRIVTALLVLFSGFIILKAWSELNSADFVSFMWIQSYIFFPVLMLGWVLPLYQRGKAAYSRLVEIYEEPNAVNDDAASQLKITPQADIALCNLTFSYPHSDRKTLSNINITIEGGSFVGITGPVGAGKTTLFRLLNREYEIPKGMIFIGGKDIHDYSLEALRQEIVTVEQIPFLFSKTLAENVSFGKENASLQEIELAAQYADLHDTVIEFPEQYSTLVGERGVTLSGGQKQRVAMARAFLVKRSILLLDDIFAAVDIKTENRIFTAMRKNFSEKTVLLITHRVSLLEQMDRVIYLKGGLVLEDGEPDVLKGKHGAYAALVDLFKESRR